MTGPVELPDGLAEALAESTGAVASAATRVRGGDINEAWRIESPDGPLFVKFHATAGAERFASEAAGLRWLAEPDTIRLPRPLSSGELGTGSYLALEWIEQAPSAGDHDEALGRGLALMHAAGADSFGSPEPAGFGSLELDNSPTATWPDFFWSRRIEPLLSMAVSAGEMPEAALALGERLRDRLPELAGPDEPPARIHGDLWAGNAMTGPEGEPVLVDPSAHGAHREVDLAMMGLFGGFSERVHASYAETHPLADGWRQRCELWQLAPLLVHAVLFGAPYGTASLNRLEQFAHRPAG